MKLNRLVLRAFGPFAGEVTVDFDALAEAGLFHVHGPTGSGKTSLFDAVCFALYGDVPGVRRADRLRCDLADTRTVTSVELEFTLPEGNFLVQRRPRQERPKRRGSGTTTDQESASLFARVDRDWVPRAAGPAEVDAEIRRLLGLTATQFQQVVLLPQGRFQEALLAPTERRRELLRTLFGTERFAAATEWLAARADALERQAELAARRVAAAAAQARHRAGEAGIDAAGSPVDVAEAVRAARVLADRVAATAAADAETAAAELRDASLAAERHARVTEARAVLLDAAGESAEIDMLGRRLERASAAERLTPLLEAHREAVARCDAAHAEASSAVMAARDMLAGVAGVPVVARVQQALLQDHDDLAVVAEAAADAARTIDALADQAASADRALAESAANQAAAEEYARVAEEADAEHERWSIEAERGRQQVEAARVAAASLPALTAERDRLAGAAAAARELITLRTTAAARAEAAEQAEKAASSARHAHLDLLSRRVDGMAIELAGQLAPDGPCPVCGSCVHPAPAMADPAGVTSIALEAIEEAATQAERLRRDADTCHQQAAIAAAQLEAGLTRAGSSVNVEACERLAFDAAQACNDAGRIAAGLDAALEFLARAQAAAESAQTSAAQARLDAATAAAGALACRQEASRRRDAVTEAIGTGCALDRIQHAVTEVARLLRAGATAACERDEAAAHASRLQAQLVPAFAAHGFATDADVVAAALSAVDQDAILTRIRAQAARIAAAQGVIDACGPDADAPPPDLEQFAERASATATDAQAAAGNAALLIAAEVEVRRLAGAWEIESPQAEALATRARQARTVADVCRGGGNQRHQALETYVLAAFCEEIADVATVRLLAMTSGRYSLAHTDARQGRQRAAGLDLAVHDGWSGQLREPGSLSGGEIFQASLALALAVAEVVQRHAGGVEMQTLLVDEGFASLDADALDLALGELDGLRAGGRTIGIISHVPGLRERIGVGLRVEKEVGGSTVTQELHRPTAA